MQLFISVAPWINEHFIDFSNAVTKSQVFWFTYTLTTHYTTLHYTLLSTLYSVFKYFCLFVCVWIAFVWWWWWWCCCFFPRIGVARPSLHFWLRCTAFIFVLIFIAPPPSLFHPPFFLALAPAQPCPCFSLFAFCLCLLCLGSRPRRPRRPLDKSRFNELANFITALESVTLEKNYKYFCFSETLLNLY